MERDIRYGHWHISWNKDVPQWGYPIANTLTYTHPLVNPATLVTSCRLSLFNKCQTSSAGDFVVMMGEEFIPDTSGNLTLEIRLPQKQAFKLLYLQ